MGASSSVPPLEICGLHKAFSGHLGIGRHPAVRGIDLAIQPGEIFGLLGPNGAGKTTTIKVVLGLLRPNKGEVRMFGRPVTDPDCRARLGYLPENPYFYDYLTAREFLDFYARLQGIPRARRAALIETTLVRVGLRGRGDVALRKFSKGMTQRLGLAQAIQHEPDLVILDEPMSGLDPVGRREVRDLILELKRAGKTVFFSSHILQDAEMICDRVGILRDGQLCALGRLDELISGRVRWFEVGVRGVLPHATESIALSHDTTGRGQSLVRVNDVEALSALLAQVRESGGEVTSIWPRRDSLEDLFMAAIDG